MRILAPFIVLLASLSAQAQLYGPNPVQVNVSNTYTYTNGTVVFPTWVISSNGTIISTSQSGPSYQAVVKWTTTGTGTLTFKDGSTTKGSVTVTVNSVAPVATAATAVTSTSFTASWGSVSGATSYKLDVATDGLFNAMVAGYNNLSVSTTSKSVTGLAGGTTYYYRVRAVTGSGTSSNSNVINVLTIPPAPAAAMPTDFAVTSFTANWAVSTSATGYRLDVSTNSAFSNFVTGYNNILINDNTHNVTGLTANTVYYYRVRAVNASGISSNSSTIAVLTTPIANLASAVTTTSFTASWGSVPIATGYQLDISTSSTFSTFVNGYNSLAVAGTSYNVTNLPSGTTYYYRVRATTSSGISDNSGMITVATVPSAPTALAATNFTTTTFQASWTSVNTSWYNIDVATDADFNNILPGYNGAIVYGTSVFVTNLAPQSTYYYRVRAWHTLSGASANSSGISALTLASAPMANPGKNMTAGSFTASWNEVPSATSYKIYVSTAPDFSSTLAGYNGLTVTNTSKEVTGLTEKRPYYYRVRAVNPSGTSAYSNTASVTLDHNYIHTVTVNVAGKTTEALVDNAVLGDKLESYSYFDGLGRPTQTIARQASPTQKDIIQPFAYDDLGRDAIKYLPYTGETNGWFKENALKDPLTTASSPEDQYRSGEQYLFYQQGGTIAQDEYPYALSVFEHSPASRIIEQGAPGADWQPLLPEHHTVTMAYEFNTANEVLCWTYPVTAAYAFGVPNAATSYAANQLYKQTSVNENGKAVIVYKDKQGKVILQRQQAGNNAMPIDDSNYASTYYVYDIFGNLVCVMPPEAASRLSAEYFTADNSGKNAFLDRWAFRYAYDDKFRLVMKKTPGIDPVYKVYDARNRTVLTQDGNQRTSSSWLFIKYDKFNRPILTGKYSNTTTTSPAAMQALVDSYYGSPNVPQFENYVGAGGAVLGYQNYSFPQTTNQADYYTVTYYDKYDAYLAPSGYTYMFESLTDPETSLVQETAAAISAIKVTGLPTGTLVKNLSTGTWLRTVNYYDAKHRLVQTVSDHHKGKVIASNIVDFTGKVVFSKSTYTVNTDTYAIKENYDFDHAGRLKWVKHAINNSTDVMLARCTYNELGQLADKNLHSTDNGVTFKQSVDYTYNIRGWMTKINQADVGSVAAGDAVHDYFGMEMGYNNIFPDQAAQAMYNGSITAIRWSNGNGGDVKKQSYSYYYDNLNRLKDADHYDYQFNTGTAAWAWSNNSGGFGEHLTYDLNGNIQTLTRKGFAGGSMDDLVYYYTGNRLNGVADNADQVRGFNNGATRGSHSDFSYDDNGNIKTDNNKGISSIAYNFLNLPDQVNKGSDFAKYVYTAAGAKLSQQVQDGSTTKTTDYIGALVYENNTLKFIQHAEGRVLPDGTNNWEYQYHLKDHLGNVRVTFTTKTQAATTATATFETAAQSTEAGKFDAYPTCGGCINTLPSNAHSGSNSEYLNGGYNGQVGLAKSFSVMPGDVVQVQAYAKYTTPSAAPANYTNFVASLLAAFSLSAPPPGETGTPAYGVNTFGNWEISPSGDGGEDDPVKVFVTIILFDRNYNFVDVAYQASPGSGALISQSYTVKEPGYAYVYISNEHPTLVDVYFDDVTMGVTPSPIVSANDYFPFGLQFNSGERENAGQKYLFGSKELQEELSLNWYDFGARMYQAEIGRWLMADPLADAKPDMTPYRYSFNDPINITDPSGLIEERETKPVEYAKGAYGELIDASWVDGDGDRYNSQGERLFSVTTTRSNGTSRTESQAREVASSAANANNMNQWLEGFQKKNEEIFGGGEAQQGGSGSDKFHFFTNESAAYEFMVAMQGRDGVEVSGFLVINSKNVKGVLVQPWNENGRNFSKHLRGVTGNGKYNMVYDHGTPYSILAHIHTHPYNGPGAYQGPSGPGNSAFGGHGDYGVYQETGWTMFMIGFSEVSKLNPAYPFKNTTWSDANSSYNYGNRHAIGSTNGLLNGNYSLFNFLR